MTSEGATSAEEARQRGNELYKKGKLVEAEAEYKKTAVLAPADPSPLSNLSSLKFEQGQYSIASLYILKSLKLADENDANQDDEAAVKKRKTLQERLVKCYMHQSRFDEARQVPADDENPPGNQTHPVLGNLDALTAWKTTACDPVQQRSLVFERIPRFMANVDNVAEYYAVGHDVARSLFDEQLKKACSPKDSVSLMFCGSGDARHIFATLLELGMHVNIHGNKNVCKNAHITVLDLKPAAIARTLIFFDMMVTSLRTRKTTPNDMPTIMAYLFAGCVLPAAVNEQLQLHIKTLLIALESDKPVHEWLFIPESTRKEVVHVLRRWQNPPKDNHYQARVVRRAVKKAAEANTMTNDFDQGSRPKGDQKTFKEFGIILPSQDFARRRDAPLIPLMKEYYLKGTKESKVRLARHVDESWTTNLTLLDFDYTENPVVTDDPGYRMLSDEEKVPAIECNPVDVTKLLIGIEEPGRLGVLDTIGNFFSITALTFSNFSGRLMIELLAGEMTDTMEQLRWDCLESRAKPSGGIDPSTFPRVYDRIHMSNIPDYVGGLAAAAIYARPLLREDKASNLQFTVLLNPPDFESHEHFRAETLMLPSAKHIQDHFSMVRLPNYDGPTTGGPPKEVLEQMFPHLSSFDFLTEGYMVWGQSPAKKLSRDKGLLSRPAMEEWLYGLFLKITLPYPRHIISNSLVNSPLNLSFFLRLVSHLANIGYPAHWLSSILATLSTGTITTTARPPQRRVTSPKDVETAWPARQVSTAPWVAQFATLLSIWSTLLPFGLITLPGTLVAPSEVAEFGVSFPYFTEDTQLRVPQFVLLFWRVSKAKALGGHQLYEELREDNGKKSTLKSEAIHIATAVDLGDIAEVKFWCRVDVIEKMKKEGGWEVFIMRTDSWDLCTRGVKVGELEMKRRWVD
ncbi:tetratricopeptide [Podospora aff. communis PSN243]|uniref:Tetratricopeptide n=1 Tax=Podospora aff. communis PSN243 TaxID=3040156 RepID=A0AAV9GMG7_9PEZI|nr:tetratricopeptide [Podospora aff. communis PSN243]